MWHHSSELLRVVLSCNGLAVGISPPFSLRCPMMPGLMKFARMLSGF